MNRRGFIGSLLGATSALVLDPERLLWVPGAKTISIPAPHRHGNTMWAQSDLVRQKLYPAWKYRNFTLDAQQIAMISARDFRIPFSVARS